MALWLLAIPWILVLIIVLRRYATRSPQLASYPPHPTGSFLSVIVPARNEAHNIERCVRSILNSRYGPLDVVVVDDHSTDDTAALHHGRRHHGRGS